MHSSEFAIQYHDVTKHHFGRYARSSGYLDWANQPNPFRRFHGAPIWALPLASPLNSPPYAHLYSRQVPPVGLNRETVGAFCEQALGLSAWKQFQDARWALRCNPSSGNLHPTEGYLMLPGDVGLHPQPGVYHYAPALHALERRATFSPACWQQLSRGLPAGAFLFALSSIHWREAWKYGERAYRYCQHDVGHALAAAAYSAATLGWRLRVLPTLADDDLARLLGLDRDADFPNADREQPDVLAAIVPATQAVSAASIDTAAIDAIAAGAWQGQANRLSDERVTWECVDAAADACRKPATAPRAAITVPPDAGNRNWPAVRTSLTAGALIRQRRSATAMDGKTALAADAFYGMLARTLPGGNDIVTDAIAPPAHVHLLLFVHRVIDLAPGMYCLVRDPGQRQALQRAMRADFTWRQLNGQPAGLPLYELASGDYRAASATVSCGQSIASDGAFAVAMLAEFAEPLARNGGWYYRRLFWETGCIGQVLYLEAEAAGVRATGIGCYFDDAVHEICGLSGHAYQSLYHFTVGGAVDDARLTTWPAYDAARHAVPPGPWTPDESRGQP